MRRFKAAPPIGLLEAIFVCSEFRRRPFELSLGDRGASENAAMSHDHGIESDVRILRPAPSDPDLSCCSYTLSQLKMSHKLSSNYPTVYSPTTRLDLPSF